MLKEKIDENCSEKIYTHDFAKNAKEKVKVVGKTIGGVLGAVNALAVKPINKIGSVVGDKTEKFKEEKLSE